MSGVVEAFVEASDAAMEPEPSETVEPAQGR